MHRPQRIRKSYLSEETKVERPIWRGECLGTNGGVVCGFECRSLMRGSGRLDASSRAVRLLSILL
jgi:hypothetical protein